MKLWYNNVKLLWWGIVLLFLLNISVITSLYVARTKTKAPAIASRIKESTSDVLLNDEFFKHNVGFDSIQMVKYKKIHLKYVDAVKQCKNNLEKYNKHLFESMQAKGKQYDTHVLYDIMSEHGKLKEATCRYYIAIRNLAKSPQKQLVDDAFRPIFSGAGKEDSWKNDL